MRNRAALFGVLVPLVLLASCADKSPPKPGLALHYGSAAPSTAAVVATTTTTTSTTLPPAAPAGFTMVVDRLAGFRIAVPVGWRQFSFDDPKIEEAVAAVKKANPKLAGVFDQIGSLKDAGGRLLAIDLAKGSSVNVIVIDPLVTSLEVLADGVQQVYKQFGGKVVSQDKTTLDGEPALVFTTEFPITAKLISRQRQVLTLHDLRGYTITLAGSEPALEVVLKSFAFLEKAALR